MTTHPTATLAGHDVGRIGYGAMQLERAADAGGPEREAAIELVRGAVDAGVDHIDTAQFYGDGVVNALLADALAPLGNGPVLVSKVGAVRAADGALVPAQRPEELRTQVEANLVTLRIEQLPVVNLRRLDRRPGLLATGDQQVGLDDQLAELIALRDAGRIGAIGLSAVGLDQLRAALPAGVVCVQNSYNLLRREDEPVLAECLRHDIAWVPFFPLGSAFPGQARVTDHPVVTATAERLGATPAQIGLAWLLAHAANVLLIPGTSSPEHLAANLAAADVVLDDEAVSALDAVAAPPG